MQTNGDSHQITVRHFSDISRPDKCRINKKKENKCRPTPTDANRGNTLIWQNPTMCVAISLHLLVQCESAFRENQEGTLLEESHHSMEARVQVSCWDLSNWCANLRTLWDRRLIRGWHEKGNIVIHIWKKRVRAICYKWNTTEILQWIHLDTCKISGKLYFIVHL